MPIKGEKSEFTEKYQYLKYISNQFWDNFTYSRSLVRLVQEAMQVQSRIQEELGSKAESSTLHLELSQLGFLSRMNAIGMIALAPMKRFLFDKKSRQGFYKFLRTVEQESQQFEAQTDERQIVNADVERQLNDIFGRFCKVKICKPEEHDLLKLGEDSYSVAMLRSGAQPTVYISELLLRSQDGHSQTKLHYQTALCEMIVGLILARNKLDNNPNHFGSKAVRFLSKQVLKSSHPGVFGRRAQTQEAQDFHNRSTLVMFSLSLRNLQRFFKNPKTLTWIPSLDSIIRGGQSTLQQAVEAGFSVATSWVKLGEYRKELLQNTFDHLVDLSERIAKRQISDSWIKVSDSQLREGAVAARYVAQFVGIKNPIQTCEAALFSRFSESTILALQQTYNFKISLRALALIKGLNDLKKEPFDVAPVLNIEEANHTLDYQQALLMQRCVEISSREPKDRRYAPSDLFALYLGAKTAELGALSDNVSKKNLGDSIHRESKFTLLPLVERLNLKLYNEMGYLLLRAFSPEITSKLKKQVSEQCARLNHSERKRFLADVVRAAEKMHDCKVESREKTYFSLQDKFEESTAILRNFGKQYGVSDKIENFLKDDLQKIIHRLAGTANHQVDSKASELASEWMRSAKNSLSEEKFKDEYQKIYKNIFSLIRNTDNLGVRLSSADPKKALDEFKSLLFEATRGEKPTFLRVSSIDKPEGRRTILDGQWIIDRVEIEIKGEEQGPGKFLELEIHSMTDQVNKDQKLGLGQYKYAFAHWVMKAKRSVCRFLNMDEDSFKAYSGIIPLQKDPEPEEQFSQHFNRLWKSLAKHGTYYRVGNQVVCIPSWDSGSTAAMRATKAYRDAHPDEPFIPDATSVFSSVVNNSSASLQELQKSFQGEVPADVDKLFDEEALTAIANYIFKGARHGELPQSLIDWFHHYYLSVCEMYPAELKAGLNVAEMVNVGGGQKSTSQILLEDIMRRAQLFFAATKIKIDRPTQKVAQALIEANADLLGYNLSLFRLRREIANELKMPVPSILSIVDRSSIKRPNTQVFSFGLPADCELELFDKFLEVFERRVQLNVLPLNAKNTKKSLLSKKLNITALDDQYTLEYLYGLAEDFGISINHIRVETGMRNQDGTLVADFSMNLRAIIKQSELTDGGVENVQAVTERLETFIAKLNEFTATGENPDNIPRKYFFIQ